ncbi:MAG: hypothetical protein SFU56_06265, partial [Capsulimonadales bacterium]|nr:hypothetical protein [Capsulimonadales bacterium]
KFKARQTTCISQMRQIVTALNLYRQDWDGKDTGNCAADFGLPARRQFRGDGSIPGHPVDIRLVRCPNQYIYGRAPAEDCPGCFTYAYIESYPYIDGYRHLSADPNWPIFSCSFHDLAFTNQIRQRPLISGDKRSPLDMGIGLNGALTWKPLLEMNDAGQANGTRFMPE